MKNDQVIVAVRVVAIYPDRVVLDLDWLGGRKVFQVVLAVGDKAEIIPAYLSPSAAPWYERHLVRESELHRPERCRSRRRRR